MPPPSLTAAPDPAAATATRRRSTSKEGAAAKVHPAPEKGAMGAAAAGGGGEGAWGRCPEWCSAAGVAGVLRRHPLPGLFACGLLLFMAVEYTIPMVRPGAPPLDLGFVATQGMHDAVAARPWLNSLLAALNTVSALPPCLPDRQIFFPPPSAVVAASPNLVRCTCCLLLFLSSDFQSPLLLILEQLHQME
jgi:hypothetical protein